MVITSESAPEVLHHYTSATGLMGIITNRCIWASSIYYLNDSRELSYAQDLFRQVASDLLDSADKTEPEISAKWRDGLDPILAKRSLDRVYPFVLSLTAQGDLLSQWRAYAAAPGSFAIGFHTKALMSVLPTGFVLRPCVYSEEQQRARLQSLLLGTKPKSGQTKNFHVGWVRLSMAFTQELAAVFKHPSFFQEEEWRCISPWFGGKYGWAEDVEPPKLEVRGGASTLIPYVKLKIPEDVMPSLISVVRVGPTPHVDLAVRAAKNFLREHGINAEAVPSTIPFRGW